MKALPIIWRWPDEFTKHIVMIELFHTSMNYIGMLTGHKIRGSGYAEIICEAQFVTSGSLKGVLSGKAYAKSLCCLKTVCEAFERLLMEQFIEEENAAIADPEALLNVPKSCNRDHLNTALNDPSTVTLIEKYHAYEDKVLKGHLGKQQPSGCPLLTTAIWSSFYRSPSRPTTSLCSTNVTVPWPHCSLHLMDRITPGMCIEHIAP